MVKFEKSGQNPEKSRKPSSSTPCSRPRRSYSTSLGSSEYEKKKKKKGLPVFAGIRPDFTGITVDGSSESLLRAFWKKKNQK
jgi:hypothetical protein